MADDVVIRAEGLGKKYVIGHAVDRARYATLREVLARGARNLQRSTADLLRGRPMVAGDETEEFWALKDIDFEVRRGEVLGIVGRNGAGKSTLLKILSRITEPTTGRVTVDGRVASLLEVGTGFHPELTGRENVYLNGAILGMSRAEIRRKFDEIVAFAEVEKFLDTPVKRYSSGMYVRLAFAVAAHLEPEILIVDEVLAVGDAEFQKKCLQKMQAVSATEHRTILFVSHNLEALRRVCQTGMLMTGGEVACGGQMPTVLAEYLTSSGGPASTEWRREKRNTSGPINLSSFSLVSDSIKKGRPTNYAEDLKLLCTIDNASDVSRRCIIGVEIMTRDGFSILTSHSDDRGARVTLQPGRSVVGCSLSPNPLLPGNYAVRVGIVGPTWELLDLAEPEINFEISDLPNHDEALLLRRPGRVVLPFDWGVY